MRCQTQQYCNGHNHIQNIVMVMIARKTILNAKLGYHFCQVILLFWLRQKVVPYTKYKYRSNYEYFYEKLSRSQEKRQTTSKGVTLRLKSTAIRHPIYFNVTLDRSPAYKENIKD